MKAVVESLKRLYDSGRLSQQQIWERVEKGTITDVEYRYIIGQE